MSQVPPDLSNYPRSSGQQHAYGLRPPGVYFDVLGPAWEVVKEDLPVWIGGALAFLIPIGIVYGLGAGAVFVQALAGSTIRQSDPGYIATSLLMIAAVSSLILIMGSGLVSAAVRKLSTRSLAFGDFFAGFRRAGGFVAFSIVYATLYEGVTFLATRLTITSPSASLGLAALFLVLSIAVAVVIAPLYLFLPARIVLERGAVWPIVVDTFARTRAFMLPIFALQIALSILGTVGCCAVLIGCLFALPVVVVAIGMHYRYFFEHASLAQ